MRCARPALVSEMITIIELQPNWNFALDPAVAILTTFSDLSPSLCDTICNVLLASGLQLSLRAAADFTDALLALVACATMANTHVGGTELNESVARGLQGCGSMSGADYQNRHHN